GWNVGEGSDLPGHLRLVGCHAAPGSRHSGPGLLLGVHESQPAAPELHINPLRRHHHHHHQAHLSNLPGRRKDGLKKTNQKQYLLRPCCRQKPPPPFYSYVFLELNVGECDSYISSGNYDDAYSLLYC
ncbi:hypothetical protein FQA47_019498, partial [Oryzias melastigma]